MAKNKTVKSNTDKLAEHYSSIMTLLGEDVKREGVVKTPLRAAKAMEYLTEGYSQDLETVINNAIFESDNDQMVILKDIEFYSLCEHHLLPFIGKCHIAYLPRGKVIGLSKLARITNMFARRFQIQENLTQQIAKAVESAIDARGVGVVVEAKHMCMMMRGVQKQGAMMQTSMMLGTFRKDEKTRSEFLRLIARD